MAISLLFSSSSAQSYQSLDSKILYHLSLDRAFTYICADVKKRESFLSVVAALVDNRQDIEYRQSILHDFLKNPILFEELASLFSRFEELRSSQKNTKKDELRFGDSRIASLSSSKNILQTQALYLKRALLFIKGFCELFSKYKLNSSGLIQLADSFREIFDNSDFSKMIAFCTKYENFSTVGFLDFKFSITEDGRIEQYELIDHKHIHITDPELKRKSISFFKKIEEPHYSCERLFPGKNDFYKDLNSAALLELSKLFSSISNQIFDRFSHVARELNFYFVALKYVNSLLEKDVPYCFPKISDDHSVKVRSLYDLYLVMSKHHIKDIVPNHFELKKDTFGLLIFGNNGSGKTVYLRSVATMQLLAQAGLPIPAESAEISLYSQISTQFSESEKEFCAGNDAGRFEQEVRELSEMVEKLQEGALVFLNETFQTTAYSEGAEGLYHILNYFSKCNIQWILVSHLSALESLFESTNLTVLHTTDGYKIQ